MEYVDFFYNSPEDTFLSKWQGHIVWHTYCCFELQVSTTYLLEFRDIISDLNLIHLYWYDEMDNSK